MVSRLRAPVLRLCVVGLLCVVGTPRRCRAGEPWYRPAAARGGEWDTGTTFPIGARGGWTPQLGFVLGLGGHRSGGRVEIGLLNWCTHDSGAFLVRRKFNLFTGWRVHVLGDLVHLQVGPELVSHTEDVRVAGEGATATTGTLGALDLGALAGVGASVPLGFVVVSAAAELHLDKRVQSFSDEVAGAEAFRRRDSAYLGVSLAVAYR